MKRLRISSSILLSTSSIFVLACGETNQQSSSSSSTIHGAGGDFTTGAVTIEMVGGSTSSSGGGKTTTGGDGGAGGGETSTGDSSGSGSSDGAGGGEDGALTLSKASLENVGREGRDIVLAVEGKDPHGATSLAHVTLEDSSGKALVAWDTNWDGEADATATTLAFDSSALGKTSFKSTITVRDLYALTPDIAAAKVALEDESGALSNEVHVTLSKQATRSLGDPCDTKLHASRCEPSTSCSGNPAACVAGVAPTLTKVAYAPSPTGPRMLVMGTDPDQDLIALQIDFLDAKGQPVTVDLDGDGSPESTGFSLGTAGPWRTGNFFVANEAALGFEVQVPKLRVTPWDPLESTCRHASLSIL